MTYPTDEAVMSAVQSGHDDLLGVLFERYQSKAFRLCYRMVKDQALADDLVQEAFLRVMRFRASFRGGSTFAPWLYRIVRNVCLDHIRASKLDNAHLNQLHADDLNESNAWSDDITDRRLELVRSALLQLSPERRTVLLLKQVDGLSYAQIAERLGTNEGAERVRAHRALRQLRTIIQSIEATAHEV